MPTVKIKVRLAVGLVVGVSAFATGQEVLPRVSPASVDLAPAALDEATALLTQLVAAQKIAGAVAAVARHGRVGYLEAVGVQDLHTKRADDPAVALPHLLDGQAGHRRGGDDAPRRGQIPARRAGGEIPAGVRRACRSWTRRARAAPAGAARSPIEDLLLHTSGLSHRTSDLYRTLGVRSRADTLPEFIAKITRAPLMEDPHTRFRYSEATTVLGRLVEIWSGQPFDVVPRAPRVPRRSA